MLQHHARKPGGYPYEKLRDAHRKIGIKPLELYLTPTTYYRYLEQNRLDYQAVRERRLCWYAALERLAEIEPENGKKSIYFISSSSAPFKILLQPK